MPRSNPLRILASLALALLLVAGMGAGLSPAAEEPPPTGEGVPRPPASAPAPHEVQEVEEYWTMWDGIRLPVSIFYPVSGDGAENQPETYPAIVFVHPWDCDKLVFDRMAEDYAKTGYVCVTYTVRGWYGAEGQIGCMDPAYEMRDLSHIITLVSEDRRFPVLWDARGPVVGVTGYSMGGCHAFLIAPRKDPRPGDPGDPRVRAVVPMHGGADLLFSLYPNGAVKFLWGTILLGGSYMGNLAGLSMNAIDIIMNQGMSLWDKLWALVDAVRKAIPPINNVTPMLAWIYGAATQRRMEDSEAAMDYLKLRSARYWCDEEYDGVVEHPIVAPTLIVAGWNDDIFYPNEGLRVLSTCMEAPARMIITNHGHIGGMGGNMFIQLPGNPEYEWVNGQVQAWFDHYLKGVDNGAETEPRLLFYRDRDPEHFGEADRYPLAGTRQLSLYLDRARGGGKLANRRPRGRASRPDPLVNLGITGSISFLYFQDVPEMMGGEALAIPTKIDLLEIPFTEAGYLSDPLPRDLTVMGAPALEMYYQCSAPFTQLIPWLYEVTPEGQEVLVSRGWYEGYDERVWTMHSTADKPVEMQACYHRFARGSRIKLEISTADLLMTWPYWNLALILLHHSRDAASRLILPVVPNTY